MAKTGYKKPIYKRVWFIILMVILAFIIIVSIGGNSGSKSASSDTSAAKEDAIVYTPYDVTTLVNDLKSNALNASEKYKGQYVALTGCLDVIDSSGKYIRIVPSNDPWAITGVQCYIKTDEQKNTVATLSIGDTVLVKGKITDVGELLGYSLNMDEITK